jgi:AraC-like DNA-binding protein
MRVSSFAPGRELAPYVRSIRVVETGAEVTRALLPETGIVLGLRFDGFACELDGEQARRLPRATLAGMRRSVRKMHTSANAGIVLAAFTELGAAAFFAEPLHEIFGATVELEQLVRRGDIGRAEERLAGAATHAERVAVMQQFLLAQRRSTGGDRLVSAAVGAIRAARGSIRVGELARELAISRDRLEKRFRRAVGASPKQLASILRLRHAVDLHQRGAKLTRLAVDAGYFDQSHFIREFRAFTGSAPQRFFQSVEHC